MKYLVILLLTSSLWSQTTSQPQYSLNGQDYKNESSLINQMLNNIALDVNQLNGKIPAASTLYNLLPTSNTFTGSNNFTSTISFSAGVTFSSSVTGVYNTNISSINADSAQLAANTSFQGITQSTSTITIKTNSRVRILASLAMQSTGGAGFYGTIMNFNTNLGGSSGLCSASTNLGGGGQASCFMIFVTSPMASGTYKFSLAANPQSANWTPAAVMPFVMFLEEIR